MASLTDILKHLFGTGDPELILRYWNTIISPKSSVRNLTVEFMNDVEILASTDYFLGATSNIYILIASLRVARHKEGLCCFISTNKKCNPLVCEGEFLLLIRSRWVMLHRTALLLCQIWQKYFNFLYSV